MREHKGTYDNSVFVDIVNYYYEDNAKRLHRLVDRIVGQFYSVYQKDMDDFYSIANEVFVDVLRKFDNEQPFENFLNYCLSRKIKTEITKRFAEKRKADRNSISIDTDPNEYGYTLKESIPDTRTVESELFYEDEDTLSDKALKYLSRLSTKERNVLKLLVFGFKPNEIRDRLGITQKDYNTARDGIYSYQNIVLLL